MAHPLSIHLDEHLEDLYLAQRVAESAALNGDELGQFASSRFATTGSSPFASGRRGVYR